MTKPNNDLTVEQVLAVLDYDPASGVFRWRVNRGPARKGDVAGSPNGEGYVFIPVAGRLRAAHRLAWLIEHGELPGGKLDHRDTDTGANAIDNLREADDAQNAANRRRFRNNTSGFKGVSFMPQRRKWQAYVDRDGRRHYLGLFDSPEAASAVATAKRQELHGDFARD